MLIKDNMRELYSNFCFKSKCAYIMVKSKTSFEAGICSCNFASKGL